MLMLEYAPGTPRRETELVESPVSIKKTCILPQVNTTPLSPLIQKQASEIL